MRSNFERHSTYICLDAMKRKTNVNLWPYMAITMNNEHNKVVVACESLMIAERHDAYIFLICSALMMAPKVTPDMIKVCFSDELVTTATLSSASLSKTKLFYDHYHLKLNMEKNLGPHLYNLTQHILSSIIYASTQTPF